jgi:hypothetical protein
MEFSEFGTRKFRDLKAELGLAIISTQAHVIAQPGIENAKTKIGSIVSIFVAAS